jgi:Sec-independent protein translocase protein TatA
MLYKLIFELILPVYHTTKQVKRKMGEMQEEMMRQQQEFQQKSAATQNNPKENSTKIEKEYIDYEEVK